MKWLILAMLIVLQSCATDKTSNTIMKQEDYNSFLSQHNSEEFKKAIKEKEHWQSTIPKDSNALGSFGYLAGNYNQLFDITGNVAYLDSVSILHDKSLAISAEMFKANSARSRAASYITQHRFKEARELLESVENMSGKQETQYMLFDAYMEVGAYDKARTTLDSLKNQNNYSYLIRAAKWNDYKGDLDTAIALLERAKADSESRNSKPLKVWTYSNIGDFYGHAGRIEDSYNSYLNTLELEPGNAYAKKGLAWIAYSHERNPEEAIRILDSIQVSHTSPDYHLLKAEIYEFAGEEQKRNEELEAYWTAVQHPGYGDMYNAYNITYLAEVKEDYDAAIALAEAEVENRATPETYDLLAYAHYLAGNNEKALELMENHVINKTFEPDALFHAALIYKANGKLEKVETLKNEELLGTAYEMGPVTYEQIKSL